jgi:hypothetical protein
MKIWKIAAIAALATVAGTLLIASVYAYMGGRGVFNPYVQTPGVPSSYGGYGGMMDGYAPYAGTPTATTPTNVTQAKNAAQQFLNVYYPGTTVGNATTFYGYYIIEVLNAGNQYGMLSVNGYTGQVWYHNWHGTFIQQIEL